MKPIFLHFARSGSGRLFVASSGRESMMSLEMVVGLLSCGSILAALRAHTTSPFCRAFSVVCHAGGECLGGVGGLENAYLEYYIA